MESTPVAAQVIISIIPIVGIVFGGTLVAWIALKKAVLRFVMRSTMG